MISICEKQRILAPKFKELGNFFIRLYIMVLSGVVQVDQKRVAGRGPQKREFIAL
jgi:hypothetical protein